MEKWKNSKKKGSRPLALHQHMGIILALKPVALKAFRFCRDQIRTISFGFWKFGHLYDNAYNSETV